MIGAQIVSERVPSHENTKMKLHLTTRTITTSFNGITAALLLALCASPTRAQTSAAAGTLLSRADLVAAESAAEAAGTRGDQASRAKSAMTAAAIRQRLTEGDFQVGDRVVVMFVTDAVHRDTAIVNSQRALDLPGGIAVQLDGVLRSEIQQRVATEVLKYVKAEHIEVKPLMRVGVLGAVARPGYFAFAPDAPITDIIMSAGGPTLTADVERSIVRRGNQEFRSAAETSKAISTGLTLDQFGLAPGDELVIGQRRQAGFSAALGAAGAMASVLALFVALRR